MAESFFQLVSRAAHAHASRFHGSFYRVERRVQNLPPDFSIEIRLALLGSKALWNCTKGDLSSLRTLRKPRASTISGVVTFGHAALDCIFEDLDCGWDIHLDCFELVPMLSACRGVFRYKNRKILSIRKSICRKAYKPSAPLRYGVKGKGLESARREARRPRRRQWSGGIVSAP
jgi:hypothetical protein